MKPYHKHNFFKNTFCIFKEISDVPKLKPDYISKNNSAYYFTPEGVYRKSNHWGRVANCRWKLDTENYHCQKSIIAFAKWTDFSPNDEQKALYSIQKIKNEYRIVHKYSIENNEQIIFRNAKECAKVVKQLKEIQNIPRWFTYYHASNNELIDFFEKGLLHSNQTLQNLKQEAHNFFSKK